MGIRESRRLKRMEALKMVSPGAVYAVSSFFIYKST